MLSPNPDAPIDPKEFLDRIQAGKTHLSLKRGAELYAQGSPADAVYYVTEGIVKNSVSLPNGKEAVLAILGPNNFLGDGCLSGLKHRRVSVTALEKTSFIRLEANAMRRLLRDEPRFAEYYISYLVERKIRTEFSLVDQLVNSSEQRLARALLQLTDLGAADSPNIVGIRISQDTLADMVGTTRSRISFFMNKFRRQGFVEYKGHIRVHRDLLRSVLDE